jgi:hypothetical protein
VSILASGRRNLRGRSGSGPESTRSCMRMLLNLLCLASYVVALSFDFSDLASRCCSAFAATREVLIPPTRWT